MVLFVSQFDEKLEEMTAQVDQAVEEENYEQAEEIQAQLETYQTANQKKYNAYKSKLESGDEVENCKEEGQTSPILQQEDTPVEEEYSPPSLETPVEEKQ